MSGRCRGNCDEALEGVCQGPFGGGREGKEAGEVEALGDIEPRAKNSNLKAVTLKYKPDCFGENP